MRLQSHLNREQVKSSVIRTVCVFFLYHIVCLDAELDIYSKDGIEIGKDDFPFDSLLIRYHNGYLSRLSNYGLKEKTYGIGFGVAF